MVAHPFFMIHPINAPHISPDANLYGGKGAGLITMASMAMPVPQGFIIPIGSQRQLLSDFAHNLNPQAPLPGPIHGALRSLEQSTGTRLGDAQAPMFLSVRSGGAISMPGMMDTFLNIGLVPETCAALGKRLKRPRAEIDLLLHQQHTTWQNYWNQDPQNPITLSPRPHDHLWQAIQAVWNSWDCPRARAYRQHYNLDPKGGTAVIVQCMVFGNATGVSGTGVLFTRHPDTGVDELFGEFLSHAQGENLVSGAVTPMPLAALAKQAPKIFDDLSRYAKSLELRQGDMQDIEFTFESGKLWLLQTRSGKRSALATFRIAHERVMAGLSTKAEAISHMDPMAIDALLHPQLSNHNALTLVGKGLAASSGAGIGHLTLDVTQVTPTSILVRHETSAEDVPAMLIAKGLITLRGGMTSHAAVIMRSIGKPCISGLENAQITNQGLRVGDLLIPTGTMLTMDGSKGLLFQGQGAIEPPSISPETKVVLSWADGLRTMGVWANADTPEDVALSLLWGADGIGLCRSEHMMFHPTNLRLMQQFILATKDTWRQNALDHLHSLHQKDFEALLKASKGKPLIVRLLDPPLHEFLPKSKEEKCHLAENWGISLEDLDACIAQRQETNPMMGQRGCRLGLAFPQLYAMQIRALFQAMDTISAQGGMPLCGLMVPFIAHQTELETLRNLFYSLVPGCRNITFGTMIETPRAALMVETLAPLVDFISFGTNDLTQMTWGLSRDDSDPITQIYKQLNIADPFVQLDIDGVGQLLSWACAKAKKTNPSIKISICGEQGANPQCLEFLQSIGIDAVSCAPFALPRMRLASGKITTKTQPL